MCGPPDGRHGVVGEEEAEFGEFGFVVSGPPTVAKEEREAPDGSHGKLVCGDEGVRDGIEDEPELLKNAKRNRDDCFAGGEFEEFSAISREDVHATAPPFDPFDGTRELDAAACLANLLREEFGEAVISVADTEELVAAHLFLGALLDGKGVNADLAVVRGVEALDVADDLFALFRFQLLQGRVVCEGEVGALPLFELVEEFEDVALFITLFELAVFVAEVRAVEAIGFKTRFVDEIPEFGRVAVDEFGSEFEDVATFTESADPSADTVAGFKNKDLAAGRSQSPGSGEAGHSGADDQYALSDGFHLGIGCGGGTEVIGNRDHLETGEAI